MLKILTPIVFCFLLCHSSFANEDAALRISRGAEITGTTLLIIGFEGLFGFRSSGSKAAENYHCKVSTGIRANKPIGGSGQVGGGLALPVMQKYQNQVKVLMYPHTSCTKSNCSGPRAMATRWMADANTSPGTNGRRLIVMGHSFGGDAAVILGNSLQKVDVVITIDPRQRPVGGPFSGIKVGRVGKWLNFYEKADLPLMGWKLDGAQNIFLHASPILGHYFLPKNPKILPALMSEIGDNLPGPKVYAGAPVDCGGSSKGIFGIFKKNGEKGDEKMTSLGSKAVVGDKGGISEMSLPVGTAADSIPVPANSPLSAEDVAPQKHGILYTLFGHGNRATHADYDQDWFKKKINPNWDGGRSKMGENSAEGNSTNAVASDPNENRPTLNKNSLNSSNRTVASEGADLKLFESEPSMPKDSLGNGGDSANLLNSNYSIQNTNYDTSFKIGGLVKEMIVQSERQPSAEGLSLFDRVNKVTRKFSHQNQ